MCGKGVNESTVGCFGISIPILQRSQRRRDASLEQNLTSTQLPAYSLPFLNLSLDEKETDDGDGDGDVDGGIKVIEREVETLSNVLRQFSLKMQQFKEIAMKEFKTHDLMLNFMNRQEGWKVIPHAFEMETALVATFEHGKGGPVIGYNSEMDALPGIGHACGHNLIAIVGMAAAIAHAKALKANNVAGKIVWLGTPAEEDIGGKIMLIERGAYNEMDVCLMAHPAPKGGLAPMLAMSEIAVQYHGHTAHAAGAPWEAINALDAAVLAYTNISALRQQIRPDERVHGILTGGDKWVTNVIPDSAGLSYGIRAPLRDDMLKLRERVYKCFKAAAEATGCTYDIKQTLEYYDLRNNAHLGHVYQDYMRKSGVQVDVTNKSIGSTDFGNVSYKVPALHPIYGIPAAEGSGNHTVGFTKAAATQEAHDASIVVAKALAAIGWKVSTDAAFLNAVKAEFEEMDKRGL